MLLKLDESQTGIKSAPIVLVSMLKRERGKKGATIVIIGAWCGCQK